MLHPLQRLLSYSRPYHLQMAQAVTCSILHILCDAAPSWLIGGAVDILVEQDRSWLARLGIPDVRAQFGVLVGLTIIIWICESLTEYGYRRIWQNLAQVIQHRLRLETYNHLQTLEVSYFEEHTTGHLLSIVGDDINQLEQFLNSGAHEILQVMTSVFVASLATFIFLPWPIASATLIPIPFIIWGALTFQRRLAPRYADVREKVGFLNDRLTTNISGMTTIKSFTAEPYESERLQSDSQNYLLSNRRAIYLSAAFIPSLRIFVMVGFVSLLLWGGLTAFAGNLSVASLSILLVLIQMLLWPMAYLGETFNGYQRAMASVRRIMSLLDTPIQVRDGEHTLTGVRGGIQFKDVTFAYPGQSTLFQQFSLEIPAGRTIGIVGSTGSGKSTLVKLMLRFYDIQSGSITLDGVDIRRLKLSDLRQAIGLVSQDIFLFHGTVAENIAYGSFGSTPDEIIQAAKVAEADDFIRELPQDYRTLIGERGQKLSGGQRQRLAIARAVLKDPPILILDEATSAVDNETEAAIQRSLAHITRNRTTIAIAHRLSTIRRADCIYVMEHGQLVESGSHDDLVAKQGIYAKLWGIQMGLDSLSVS